jgi:hypothetical protein
MIRIKTKEGKEYVLEFDRDSVAYLEKLGFSLDKYSEQPMTMMPLLFRAAFFKNHKFEKNTVIDELYNNIKNRNKLISALVDMVGESYQSLVEDNSGNVDWEMA